MQMKFVDRLILLVIAAGIWTFILQPSNIAAHDDNDHSCSGSGTGYGQPEGDEVYVYQLNLEIECAHY
jgi:hypothetical protein